MQSVIGALNLDVLRLALRDRALAREFVAGTIRRFNEMMGFGLPKKDPVVYLYDLGLAVAGADEHIVLPTVLAGSGGGTKLDEIVVLASITRLLRPSRVFEIGTFAGRTTSVFILNAPAEAEIITLDLPDDAQPPPAVLDTDAALVSSRRVGRFLREHQLERRCRQILADSLAFDPRPYAGTVELGFIDGAHSRRYVENDTRKMAAMMAERGLVFWHDYGGIGRFGGLTAYLEELAARIPVYRVAGTTLAWAPASEVRQLADGR
jgi:hypothetical protein